MGIFFYLLGIIAVIAGAFFIEGWVSWIVVFVGILLQGLGKIFSEAAGIGKTDKTILKLLFLASSIDEEVSEEENKYVQEYIKRRGLSDKQVKAVLADIKNKDFGIQYTEDEKMRIIDEIVGILKADGVVTDNEKKFLEAIADSLNIDKKKALAKLN